MSLIWFDFRFLKIDNILFDYDFIFNNQINNRIDKLYTYTLSIYIHIYTFINSEILHMFISNKKYNLLIESKTVEGENIYFIDFMYECHDNSLWD